MCRPTARDIGWACRRSRTAIPRSWAKSKACRQPTWRNQDVYVHEGTDQEPGRRQARLGHDAAHAVDAEGRRALPDVSRRFAEEARMERQDRAPAWAASAYRAAGEYAQMGHPVRLRPRVLRLPRELE